MDEYTPGKAHEELVELIWANVPAWEYPTDVDRLAEAIVRYWLVAHDREVAAQAWDEGFDAGERDVMLHKTQSFDDPCIPNPYRSTEGDF